MANVNLCSSLSFPYVNPNFKIAFFKDGLDLFENMGHLPDAYLWHLANELQSPIPCLNGGVSAYERHLKTEAENYCNANGYGKFYCVSGASPSIVADFGAAIRSPLTFNEYYDSDCRILQEIGFIAVSSAVSGMTGRHVQREIIRTDYTTTTKPLLVNYW